jgi:zinc protease
MENDDLEEAKEQADIAADLHPEKYGIVRTLKGVDKVNDADAYVVEAVNAKGGKTTEYYDTKSGWLVKKVQSGEQGSQSIEYGDYQEIPGAGGYKIPYSVKISAGGQVIPGKVETAEVNKNIPDTEFN